MLLYDWKKIYKEAGGSSQRVIWIVKSMLMTKPPKNFYDPLYKYHLKDFSGYSFLINPDLLMRNAYKWKEKSVADYIGLASFRSLNDYKIFGKTTLDLSHSPMGQDKITSNGLLQIKGDNIHFYYEDYD